MSSQASHTPIWPYLPSYQSSSSLRLVWIPEEWVTLLSTHSSWPSPPSVWSCVWPQRSALLKFSHYIIHNAALVDKVWHRRSLSRLDSLPQRVTFLFSFASLHFPASGTLSWRNHLYWVTPAEDQWLQYWDMILSITWHLKTRMILFCFICIISCTWSILPPFSCHTWSMCLVPADWFLQSYAVL